MFRSFVTSVIFLTHTSTGVLLRSWLQRGVILFFHPHEEGDIWVISKAGLRFIANLRQLQYRIERSGTVSCPSQRKTSGANLVSKAPRACPSRVRAQVANLTGLMQPKCSASGSSKAFLRKRLFYLTDYLKDVVS